MKTKIAAIASVFALAATPLLADSEHDFPLTMDEFLEAYPEVTPEQYSLIDTAGDGEVSEEEYESAREMGLIGDSEG